MKRLYNHHFPTPAYLAMNSFAIDMSDQSIKYGQLITTSQGLRLGKYDKEKLPEGVIVLGKIEREAELVRILTKIKEKENIRFIRVSLPEEQMYLFTLSLPKTEDINLKDMILLQIEEHVPLKAPDCLFEYEIIKEDEKNILVEVVAIANATMDTYLSVFTQAGLIPLSFELEAQAIARAVIPEGEDNPVMIVDFGDSKTGISIAHEGRVFLTTTLSIGGIDLTNMIAKDFSLSFEEAEKMKHEYGLDKGVKAKDIFPAILNGISVLRDEITKQSSYWETHNDGNNGSKINHIILCGGDANLAGLAEYLELSMKIKVENANVWVNILRAEDSIPEMSFEESLGYATVLGLSLGGYLRKSQQFINVLPEKEKSHLRREYWIRFSTMFLNIFTLIGVIATLLLFPSYFLSQLKENIVERDLEKFNQENSSLKDINMDEIIKDVNLKLDILNKNKSDYFVSVDVIENILSNRTSGITFSQILFNKQSQTSKSIISPVLEIRGVARDRDALRNFKNNLENNPDFSSVDLPISNFLEKTNLSFTISIVLK